MGLFKKIGEALRKTKEAFSRKIDALLSHGEIDDELFEESLEYFKESKNYYSNII